MSDAPLQPPQVLSASPRIAQEWASSQVRPLLRQIVIEAARYASDRWAWVFFFTCIFRSFSEDIALEGHGVHPLWRAVDVRTYDQKPEAVADVVEWINARWVYDPSRPALVVAYAKPHGTGPHIHFQVCSSTVRKGA